MIPRGICEMIIKQNQKRILFRIRLDVPLCSKISIHMIKNKEVKTKETNGCIRDIGPGGLCFCSHLEFPARENIILNFTIVLLKRNVNFQGRIVRGKKLDENIWEYGVYFDVDEMTRLKYMRLFNQLSINIIKRKSVLLYSFCMNKNKENCLKIKAS